MSSPPAALDHPGERLAVYFERFFTTIVSISTLGASLSFSKVVSTPITPWDDHGISSSSVQSYLSISFLLLTMDIALTSAAASALSLYRPQAVRFFGTADSHDRRVVMWWASLVSAVLLGLLLSAFLFLSLVIAAYTGAVGWAAVAFTSLFSLGGLVVIVWQSPIGSPPPEESGGRRGEDPLTPYRSPEKTQPTGFAGDDYYYADERQGLYMDGGLSRTNTLPPIDPVVPHYTADLRRLRSVRASEDSRYGGRGERPREDWKSEFRSYANSPGY
jgi:hypothetical protein